MYAEKMKAVIVTKYGSPDVLKLREVPIPVPKDNEVLVRIHASTATAADSMMRQANPAISRLFLGFNKPKNDIIGTGFAGEVEAVGKNVTQFQEGDKVFGEAGLTFGANAEYISMAEDAVIHSIPNNMNYEQAATLCDGHLTSLNFLQELAGVQAGQKVLINGASGSLGTAAVQLAKYFGAEVTGVCSSRNTDLVKSLGADQVIDYHQTDFTKGNTTYDIIYDTVGKSSFTACKSVLKSDGVYMSPVLNFRLLLQMLWTSKFGDKKAKFTATGLQPAPKLRTLLSQLVDLIEADQLKVVIDRRYPLAKVAEAHHYVDSGRKAGNVVIRVA
jgi:NADPH:quinone reductase-like Zn-dependent oxidoreductase